MRILDNTLITTLLALIVLGSGCNHREPASAASIFEDRLKTNGVEFKIDQSGLYTIDHNGWILTVNLENVAKDYNRSKDASAVQRFADRLLADYPAAAPTWDEVLPYIRFSLEPDNYEGGFKDVVHKKLIDGLACVYVFTSADESRIAWITKKMISDWNVSEQKIQETAVANMREIARLAKVEYKEKDGAKLGMISTEDTPFKASLLLADNFRELVEPSLGFPVYAAAPCRDFVYLVPHTNQAFLGRLGGVVKREYEQSGYPITMDVLEISETGIRAIGTFGSKAEEAK